MSKYKKVTILVAVYNEEHTIKEVLEKTKQALLPHGLEKEIIVIDDGSRDSSRKKLRHPSRSRRLRTFMDMTLAHQREY